jgi:uncharacterized RDD family membrane protein YckC
VATSDWSGRGKMARVTTPPPALSPGEPGTPFPQGPAPSQQAPDQQVPVQQVPVQQVPVQQVPVQAPGPYGAPQPYPGGQFVPAQRGWVPPPPGYRPIPPPLAPNGFPLAGFGDRLLAYLLDSLVLTGLMLVPLIPAMIGIFWIFFDSLGSMSDPSQYDANGYYVGNGPGFGFVLAILGIEFGLMLVGVALTYVYFVEFQLRRGQTIGKKVMKLKIVAVDPAEIQLQRGAYAKRWAVQNLVSAVLPFFSYLDGLWQLWDKPLQQCLHDKAAKTVVVKVG